jgi:hypothetical protein
MSNERETSKDHLPKALEVDGPGETLAAHLLEGKLIHYTDDRFQVSLGEGSFILQLVQVKETAQLVQVKETEQEKEKMALFYAQVPDSYPLPDDLKMSIKMNLEAQMKRGIDVEFINAGTQAQRKDILQNAHLMGEQSGFKHRITMTEAEQCVAEATEKYSQPIAMPRNEPKKKSLFRFFQPTPETISTGTPTTSPSPETSASNPKHINRR